MKGQHSSAISQLRPGKLGLLAILLFLFAGTTGLLNALLTAHQPLGLTFWLKLIASAGFLATGILQTTSRVQTNRKLKALSSPTSE